MGRTLFWNNEIDKEVAITNDANVNVFLDVYYFNQITWTGKYYHINLIWIYARYICVQLNYLPTIIQFINGQVLEVDLALER